MRTLSANERRLLLFLATALFLLLNLFLFRSFLQTRAKLARSITESRAELASDREVLNADQSLASANSWIASHPMPEIDAEDASARLLRIERDEAEKAGLKVTSENLLPPQEGPWGSSVSVTATIAGPFQGVVKMLFALQSPEAWRTMEKLALRSDTEPPNVVAELEIRQYFRPLAATVSPATPPNKPAEQ